MQVQDLTRYLFLHAERHILNQQSTDSMRAFPGFPSWTKSWTRTLEPNFPDAGVHCVLPPPWTPKETLEFPVPPYMTSHPSGLMSPGNPPLITHKAECILVPPPPGIHWNWPVPRKAWQLSTSQHPSLVSWNLHGKSYLRPYSWLTTWTNMGFLWKINKSNGLSNCMERLLSKEMSGPECFLAHETVSYNPIKYSCIMVSSAWLKKWKI